MNKRPIRKNENMKPFIVILLIIITIAVIAGYFGTRYVVYPLFIKDKSMIVKKVKSNIEEGVDDNKQTENNNSDSDNKNSVTSKTNGFTIYNVQLGNFGSKENADALIEDLKEAKVYAYILNDNGYKVVTSPVTEYNFAEIQKNNIKEFSEDAFILKREVSAEKETTELTIKKILNNVYKAKKDQTTEQYIEELRKNIKESLNTKSLKEETTQVFQSMYDEVNKDEYKKELYELEQMIIENIEQII